MITDIPNEANISKNEIPFMQGLLNLPICNTSIEQESNKEYKFITKKRGRKNKDNPTNTKGKNVHSKFSNDNIKRRIKGLFNNYIIHLLNTLSKKRFKKYKIKFMKMNIRVTKDIGIEYNRNLLEKNIKDIIINVSKKYNNLENNKKCIEYILSRENVEDITAILNMTYKGLYTNYYLKSTDEEHSYEAHKEKLLDLYGKEYLERFVENAENFVAFFQKGKKRKSRKEKEKENGNLETENNETLSTGCDGAENIQVNKTMVSIGTQTDIEGINVKLIAFG